MTALTETAGACADRPAGRYRQRGRIFYDAIFDGGRRRHGYGNDSIRGGIVHDRQEAHCLLRWRLEEIRKYSLSGF